MPRTVQITLPVQQTDDLITELQRTEGIIGLRLQRGISVQPPGDVVTVALTNRALPDLMHRLTTRGIGHDATTSITTSEPISIISSSAIEAIVRDTSDATWEEMEVMIGKKSNMTSNVLIVMAICGIIATIGIATNALHIVMGAMLIAPGFEPITRIALGIVTRSVAWRRGVYDMTKGYGVLILAAAVTTLTLRLMGKNPLGGEASYLPNGVLIAYWTTITLPSLLVTVTASVAGALLVATNRSVLTAGVMVALALIPAATISGMGLAASDWDTSGRAFIRWMIEAGSVGLCSFLVFIWKQRRVRHRKMLL